MKMKDLKRQSHKILPKYPFFPKIMKKKRKNWERGNFQRKLKDTKRLLISILTPKRTKEVGRYKTTVD